MFAEAAHYIDRTIIYYFILFNAGYILLLLFSIREVIFTYQQLIFGNVNSFLASKILPPVTIIVSLYNEEETIITTIESLLKLTYPQLKICIMNDGSTDKTLEMLIKEFDFEKVTPSIFQKIRTKAMVLGYYVSKKHSNITLIDKEHSGKADSLNIGINASQTPFFASVDADTIIEPDAINIMVYALLSQQNAVAIGGSVYVLNACKTKDGVLLESNLSLSPIVAVQTCEYLRAFVFGRLGWNKFGGPIVLSGALTLFEHSAVNEVMGYSYDTVGEDMEVVMKLHQYRKKGVPPNKILYTFAASAWTYVPETISVLVKQRNRWHIGLIESLMKHKRMMFNPRYGYVGLFTCPFYFLGEFMGPLVECAGYFALIVSLFLNILDWEFAVLFFLVSVGLDLVMTMATVLVSFITFNKYRHVRDVFLMVIYVIVECFGYRQLIVLTRVKATIDYLIQRITREKEVGWT